MKNLQSKTVGIAGIGGLGSNCAASLARCGVGRLVVADFDIVSEANLDRQFYFVDQVGMLKAQALMENLLRINPEIEVLAHNCKITKDNVVELFAGCDVVVEAFDDAAQKEWFILFMQERFPQKPLVAASGIAGSGNIEELRVLESGTLFVCGDFSSEVSPLCPPLAPRVGIVANMQADTVLQILNKF